MRTDLCSRVAVHSGLGRSLLEPVQHGPLSKGFSSETCSKLTACLIGCTAHSVQPLPGGTVVTPLNAVLPSYGRDHLFMG